MATMEMSEVQIVQNPAVAATMIWRCGMGYQEEGGSRTMEMPLAFLVLPICLHWETLNIVLTTQRRSGLSLFASKISAEREKLLAVHLRALAYRDLTWKAIGMGLQTQLLSIDYASAKIRSNHAKLPRYVPERVKSLVRGSEKVGAWCGRLTMEQVTTILRIDL